MSKPHKWTKEIHAWVDGAKIQSSYCPGHWCDDLSPAWHMEGVSFRIKPQTKLDVAIEALEKFATNPYCSPIVSAEAKRILREIRSME